MANFYNQATLAYNGKTVNSNITIGEIVEKITVTKTAVLDRYYADSEILAERTADYHVLCDNACQNPAVSKYHPE